MVALLTMSPCRLEVVPCRLPAVTVMPPEKVLAPVNISAPAPLLETDPVPVMLFDRVVFVGWLRSSEPVTSILPLMTEPFCRVKVLAPPVKVMALAVGPPLVM